MLRFSRPVLGVLAVALFAVALVLIGCGGDDGGDSARGTGTARVVLTDAPMSDVREVHVHITRVEAISQGGAQTLVTDADIPDDIELIGLAANPLLLGQPLIPAGDYTQIRMILDAGAGENWIIDGDGVRHDLTVPSGPQTGAKLVTGAFSVANGETITILLDFNAAASVHEAGQSGQWIMRPTIFASVVDTTELDFGTVQGTVLGEDGLPLPVEEGEILGVFVETPFDPVAVAQVDPEDGSFEIPAILVGRYSVRVRYADPDDWEPITGPLDLLVDGDIQEQIVINLDPEEVINLAIVVDLTT